MIGAVVVVFGRVALRMAADAWRRNRDRPAEFTFRSIENLGPGFAGGDNAWHGALVYEKELDATAAEELRAAVERYRFRYTAPVDGDRFRLVHGDLWKI